MTDAAGGRHEHHTEIYMRRFAGAGTRSMMLVAILAAAAPSFVQGQYFGRNKVQYQTFDFRVLSTQHYDLHYYPAESLATADAARMAERWYTRLSGIMRHNFNKKPLVFYADHPDFEQTNVIGGFIDQSTGGVTEAQKNRVVMPFTGIYAENDHVLGHEMVHVFQYDIAENPDERRLPGTGAAPALAHRRHGRVPVGRPRGSAHRDVDARRGRCATTCPPSRSSRPIRATSRTATARRCGRTSAESGAIRA